MQSTSTVFCVEDTVGSIEHKHSVGVIDRTRGDVDSHEPRPQRDYADDIERHDDISPDEFAKFLKSGVPPRGAVLVAWQTQDKTELVPEARLYLLDRALYVGDVVKRSAEEHMSGTVIGLRAVCNLFPATQYKDGDISQTTSDALCIRHVPAAELLNVHEFNEGALVVYGDWVGRVENVYDEVAVKLPNNSVVVVEDPGELELTREPDTTPERVSVGDSVKTKKGNLRNGRWKYGAYSPNVRPEGVVVETRTFEVDVQWLGRSIRESDATIVDDEPPATLGRDEFESPTFYKYDASNGAAIMPVAEVAVGDRVRFVDPAGAAVKYDGTHTLPDGTPQGKLTHIARTESLGYDLNVFMVMQTHTHVTVQWQDLSVTEDPSLDLLPDPNVDDDDELWPGEVVLSKDGHEGHSSEETWKKKPSKVGVVQAVKSRDRIAQVRWFKNPHIEFFGPDLLRPSSTGELDETIEEVSLYDVYSFPALTRRRNDFVLIHPNSIEGLQAPLDVSGPDWFGEVVDLGLDGRLTVRLGAAKPVVDVKVPYEGVTLAYSSDMDDEFLHPPGVDGDSMDESDSEASDFDDASFNEMWIEYDGMDGGEPVTVNEEEWATEDEDDDESGDDDDDTSMPDLEEVDAVITSNTTPENKSPVARDEQPEHSRQPDTSTPMDEDTPEMAQDPLADALSSTPSTDFTKMTEIELPAAFDAHVHLRDGEMSQLVTPTIRKAGVNQVFVMPNLVPPITTVQQCLEYRDRLRAIEPNVDYLMSLYLHESITPQVIREAKKAGITGVKSYPAGVTTNSSSGVLDYATFYPVFAEMEKQNMVLNLHGEVPSTPSSSSTSATAAITILNAEPAFLPTLLSLHTLFPSLRIILEHCSTASAIAAVRACGPSVAGTITAHHLSLTIDDWAGDPFCFCKPVAKTPEDRDALLQAVVRSKGRFFLGTDSAPHDHVKKRGEDKVAAGVFTQPYALGYVLDALDVGIKRGVIKSEEVGREMLEGYFGGWGRRFYQVGDSRKERVVLRKGMERIVDVLEKDGVSVSVVPFRKGEETWSVEWKEPDVSQLPDISTPMDEDTPGVAREPLSDPPSSFLILDTPPPDDHRYLYNSTGSSKPSMRRIGKEHKILQDSLPPGIFVRTWESRLDLIRVLMIGPEETPYEYAPFVIDFHIGSTFPQSPPEAYFHSWTNGNGPVNPNLYEDGKICLSLLGTWHTDERNESWSPAKSTLLQVLVSLMGLVLVKEPYYNEAGYDVHRSAPETKLSSALYTERAYFRARSFISHALTNDIAPFQSELEYLYRSRVDGAPRLLDKAISSAKETIERSAIGADEGERDGLRTVSLGAVVMLKRQVEKLETLAA
jgi:dihydroorotase (homodimeric type)